MKASTLLVILPFRLSPIIEKGELIARYFNPGNLFDDVHILLTNDDQPDKAALHKMVGTGRLHLHNYPFRPADWLSTAGMRPALLDRWANGALPLVRRIQPNVIRCHGAGVNAYLAYAVQRHLGIPYLISIHSNPDEQMVGIRPTFRDRIFDAFLNVASRQALLNADLVLPVYQSQVDYLKRLGVRRYEVCYNVINPEFIQRKLSYRLHNPIRVVSVGRHFAAKNPENLIRAMVLLPNSRLTLIGNGPIQSNLTQLVQKLDLGGRVQFIHNMPNDEVCRFLIDQDVFAIHVANLGISKTAMEAMLAGLPCVINQRIGPQVPELQGGHVQLVENSAEGYANAIRELISNNKGRAGLAQRAYDYAMDHWAPETTEAKYVEVYRRVLAHMNTDD